MDCGGFVTRTRPAERGGRGGAICSGPQPMKGPQNEEVKQVYKLYREQCLKNWMHLKSVVK